MDIKRLFPIVGITLLILVILFLIYLIVLFILYIIIHKRAFKRYDISPKPYLPSFEDFETTLTRTKFVVDKTKTDYITGYIYQSKKITNPKALIVLSHGYASNHIQYLREIELLCNEGYLVIGYDNIGNSESGGKSQVSLYYSVVSLDRVLTHIEHDATLKNYKIGLYGHSWGGFAVLAIGNYNHDIKCIFSRSGFETESQTILDGLRKLHPLLTAQLRPFVFIFNFIMRGKRTLISASKGALKMKNTHIYSIHAKDDPLVLFHHSATSHLVHFNYPNVTTKIYETGGHKLFFSKHSKEVRQVAIKAYKDLEKTYDGEIPLDKVKEYITKYPLDSLYEENSEVRGLIIDFFNKCL